MIQQFELEQEKQPAVIQAGQLFLSALRSGKYPAGSSIKESVLAREYDLPRTAVRELLNQALQWNLVEYAAYRGFRIREFTIRNAWEWCNLREGIEPVAARLLAQNCPPEVLQELRNACTGMAECPDPASRQAWNYDIAFHSTVVRCCGNQCISGLHTHIYLPSNFYYEAITRYESEAAANGVLPEITDSSIRKRDQDATLFWHSKMLEAIEARQDKWAEYLFREHLHDIRIKHEALYLKSIHAKEN